MSKIVSMSTGAIDPIAQSKRVFWRPVTDTLVLKVGQPVCYNSDLVGDHKERTGVGGPPTDDHLGGAGTVYAEGSQTYTGRLFCVEEPLKANLGSFAGICKCLGPKDGADGDMIEIWVPNGAILPCRIDAVATLDETILGIRDGEADVSYPGNGTTNPGRPIGVAKEDRATAGLCWVKVDPNMFSFQYGISDAVYLKMQGSHPVNKQYVELTTTAPVIGFLQDNRLLYNAAMVSGQLTVHNNYLHFTGTNATGVATYIRGVTNVVHLTDGSINSALCSISACYGSIGGDATITRAEHISAFWADMGLAATPVAGYEAIRITNQGAGVLDALISAKYGGCDYIFSFDYIDAGIGHVPIVKMTGGHTFDATDYAMKVNLAGATFYIPLMGDLGA